MIKCALDYYLLKDNKLLFHLLNDKKSLFCQKLIKINDFYAIPGSRHQFEAKNSLVSSKINIPNSHSYLDTVPLVVCAFSQ